jgi:hypothetical protein
MRFNWSDIIFTLIFFATTVAFANLDGGFKWVLLNSKPKPYTGYSINKNKIYPPGHEDPTPLKDADLATFMVAVKGKETVFWAKDKNHVFYAGEIVGDADLGTFEVLSNQTAKDKNHVYCWNGTAGNFAGDVNTRADRNTFREIAASQYYRDDKNIYDSSCSSVKGADAATFEVKRNWNPTMKFDAKDKTANTLTEGRWTNLSPRQDFLKWTMKFLANLTKPDKITFN